MSFEIPDLAATNMDPIKAIISREGARTLDVDGASACWGGCVVSSVGSGDVSTTTSSIDCPGIPPDGDIVGSNVSACCTGRSVTELVESTREMLGDSDSDIGGSNVSACCTGRSVTEPVESTREMLGDSVMVNVCGACVLLGPLVNPVSSLIGTSLERVPRMLGAIVKNRSAGIFVSIPTGVLVFTAGAALGVGGTGALEGEGVSGRQLVFAQQLILSGHSVSDAVIHGEWQFAFTSSQDLPQKKECRISSEGLFHIVMNINLVRRKLRYTIKMTMTF
jgi:hypothetical protein